MRNARVRTESMAQRLAKQPMSEGFTLWDKGYTLGAMRLFIFKAENSPPFQLGPCLEAIGHLLLKLEEGNDAQEHFQFAREKYAMIQQPLVASLMDVKSTEAVEGPEAALSVVEGLLKEHDAAREAAACTDAKKKTGLARLYAARADLLAKLGRGMEGIDDAQLAVQCGWDRVFVGHHTLGVCFAQAEKDAEAVAAFQASIAANVNYVAAYDDAAPLLQKLGKVEDAAAMLDKSAALHPKADTVRAKAFLLSEAGKDQEALAWLEQHIANPPQDETEALFGQATASLATLYKAKAAILADAGDVAGAKDAVSKGLEAVPGDEECTQMLQELEAM